MFNNEKMKPNIQKILSLLRVSVRPDGLEVSDQVLRFAYFYRGAWQLTAIRLAPGIMEKGVIKDAAAFAAALHELKSKLPPAKREKRILNVFVAMSSVNMYSQVFTLPFMEGGDLDKAIELNVQMISPVDISHAYFGWQLLSRDETTLRSEIAAAFADKAIVDAMTQALYTAGFVTVGVESRALPLVRALREKGGGVDKKQSYLLVDVDSAGVDFLIVRNGALYFEYATPWADIADEKGQIAVAKFEEALSSSMRQVLNFYSQHWLEPLAGVILSAVAFGNEAVTAIQTSSALPIIPFALAATEQQIPSEWMVAFGCGLRGFHAGLDRKEINLSGSGAMDAFNEERMTDFLGLWRVIVPVVLGCLVVIFVLVDNFLVMTKANVESSAGFTQKQGSGFAEITALTASSTEFNQSVALVANAEAQMSHNYLMIADINTIAAANDITISSVSFQSTSAPILVVGSAPSETQIAAFQNAIQKNPHFGTVTLPLLNIQANGGAYTFSMSFPLSSTGY
jgi:Tfp pilus assembly PilM family ATPase